MGVTIQFYSYVESNEQTKLTNKLETDSMINSRLTARGAVSGGGIKQKQERKSSWTWTTVWRFLERGVGGD